MTTFKNPSDHIFLLNYICQRVSLFFAEQNEQVQISAHLRTFKELFKTNTERTTPNNNEQQMLIAKILCAEWFGEQQRQNEQSTNSKNDIPTAFGTPCSVVRRNLRYTLHLCAHLRYNALCGVVLLRLGLFVCRERGRTNIASQCESYRHPTVTHSGSYRHPFARHFFAKSP